MKMNEEEHRKLWSCLDCTRYIKFTCECPMLHDTLWLSIASKKDFLCFDCVEVRLGREMTVDDMKPEPPVNYVLVTLLKRAQYAPRKRKPLPVGHELITTDKLWDAYNVWTSYLGEDEGFNEYTGLSDTLLFDRRVRVPVPHTSVTAVDRLLGPHAGTLIKAFLARKHLK